MYFMVLLHYRRSQDRQELHFPFSTCPYKNHVNYPEPADRHFARGMLKSWDLNVPIQRSSFGESMSESSDNARLCELAVTSGMIDPKVIEVKNIVLGEWVRWKCRYGCPDYGLWLKCPPYSPTPAETQALLREYKRALIFRMKPTSGYTGTHVVGKVYKTLADLETKIFLSGHRKALAFGGGECDLCKTCNIRSGHCRRPDIARPSMEGCGIDVFGTAQRAGYEMSILKNKNAEFTWFGMILVD